MRYFTYIADQSFKTAPNGDRVFYQSGAWSRPYIIPDAATEQRLYWKQVWLLRITLGIVILGIPIVVVAFPGLPNNSPLFLAILAGLAATSFLISRLVFARDLKGLRRADARLPMKSFYGNIAGFRGIVLGIAACLCFVAIGVWMLATGQSTAVAVVNIVIFGLSAIAWTYALILNRAKRRSAQRQGPIANA